MKSVFFLLIFVSSAHISLINTQMIGDIFSKVFMGGPKVFIDTSNLASMPHVSSIHLTQDNRLAPPVLPTMGMTLQPKPLPPRPTVQKTLYEVYRGGPTESIQCQCTTLSNCEQETGYRCDANEKVEMVQAMPGDRICCAIDNIIC